MTYPGRKTVHVGVDGGDAVQHSLALALGPPLWLRRPRRLLLLLLLLPADLLAVLLRLRDRLRPDCHAIGHGSAAGGWHLWCR